MSFRKKAVEDKFVVAWKVMLKMHRFDYFSPKNLSELLEVFADYGKKAKALAGGTDLVLFMENGRIRPEVVIEIPHEYPFTGIELNDKTLRVGARTTMRELEVSPLIRQFFPALAKAASEIGSVQIRNLATLGGNICTASPAGDTLTALLCYDALLRLRRKGNERTVPITDFFLGPGETVIQADEVLTDVLLHIPQRKTGSSFYKLSVRNYMDIAIVNVTAVLTTDEDGVILDARLALGSVAPTPIRAYDAEERLKGNRLNESLLEEVAKISESVSRPITDQRGSKEYRLTMVYRLTKQSIQQAYKSAVSDTR